MAFEMKEIADYIKEKADPKALIKVGTVEGKADSDRIQVTVIATGFRGKNIKEADMPQPQEEPKPRDYGFIGLTDWDDMINHTRKRTEGFQKDNWSDIINTPALYRSQEFLQFQKNRDRKTDGGER
jgi:cell division protein FtsZ